MSLQSTKLVSFFIKLEIFPFFEGLDQGINNYKVDWTREANNQRESEHYLKHGSIIDNGVVKSAKNWPSAEAVKVLC